MAITLTEVRPGAYFDSVVLMQLQRALTALPGVLDAGVVMATPANRDLLAASELQTSAQAGPNDLLIVVKAADQAAAEIAIGQVDALLTQRSQAAGGQATVGQDYRPRSLAAAVRQLPEARWVLVSVPGQYAAGLAEEALELGRSVFLYSDNVALNDEIRLKQMARQKGLLLMGPDCGTAIINGVGLGFANRVRRGPVGLVGASGTGLQTVTAALHNLGSGITQAIGTGSRDLKAEVGAVSTEQGLRLLAGDPETKVIVLVSKPPDPKVAGRLLALAQTVGKPVVVNFIAYPSPGRRLGNLHFATSLAEAASLAAYLVDRPPDLEPLPSAPLVGFVRGLFSGGTLAVETLLGLQTSLYPIYSNVAITAEQRLAEAMLSGIEPLPRGHAILDLGDDVFTQGRLHPMMDNDLRLRRMRQEAVDPEVGLILLDVVLGEGAHPDPAAELAPAIAQIVAERPALEVAAIVIGTDQDPQQREEQAGRLAAAGASVFDDTMAAANYISRRQARFEPELAGALDLVDFTVPVNGPPLAAINVGLASFYDSLRDQGAAVVQVEWRPPAGGDEKLLALLARMKGSAAN
jgi:FdrA protein